MEWRERTILAVDWNRSASGCSEEAVSSFKFLCSQAKACNSGTWCEFYTWKTCWLKWSYLLASTNNWMKFCARSRKEPLCFKCTVYHCAEVCKDAEVIQSPGFISLPTSFDKTCCCLHSNILQLLHILRSFQWSRPNNPHLCLHSGNVARRLRWLRWLREGWNLSATYLSAWNLKVPLNIFEHNLPGKIRKLESGELGPKIGKQW